MGNWLDSVTRRSDDKDQSPEDSPKFRHAVTRTNSISQKLLATKVVRILLLGTGMSGKSTFFLQYQLLKNTMSQNNRGLYRSLVYRNVILNVLEVMDACINQCPEDPFSLIETTALYQSLKEKLSRSGLEGIEALTVSDMGLTNMVFEDEKFMDRLKSHQGFRYFDNIDYFFDLENRKRMFENEYEPTNEDMLCCRKKTTGITKMKFTSDDLLIELTDVGGQRSERLKWKKCFELADLVLYVVSLSDYDEILFEASNQNSMSEALDCFDRSVNGEWFQKKRMVLLFSKQDVLTKKIQQQDDLKKLFSDYDGGQDPSLAIQFIMKKFLDRVKDFTNRIVPLVVTLTDLESVISIDAEIMKGVEKMNFINGAEKLKF
jgi:guanine nucleotide-binding protein G(i) subunit alpha